MRGWWVGRCTKQQRQAKRERRLERTMYPSSETVRGCDCGLASVLRSVWVVPLHTKGSDAGAMVETRTGWHKRSLRHFFSHAKYTNQNTNRSTSIPPTLPMVGAHIMQQAHAHAPIPRRRRRLGVGVAGRARSKARRTRLLRTVDPSIQKWIRSKDRKPGGGKARRW